MSRLTIFKIQHILLQGMEHSLALLFKGCSIILKPGQTFTLIDLVHSLLEPHHRVLRDKPVNTLGKIQHARLRVLCVIRIVGDEH